MENLQQNLFRYNNLHLCRLTKLSNLIIFSRAVDTDAVSISHETTHSLALVVSVSLCSPNGSQGIAMPRKKVVFQYRCDEVSCYLKIRSAKWNAYCLKKHMYKFKRCFPNFSIKCVNSSSVLQNKTTFISSGSQGLD